MSNKTLDILKGSFFALIFIFCLITRIKDAAASWTYVGMVITAVATIGFFKRAFDDTDLRRWT